MGCVTSLCCADIDECANRNGVCADRCENRVMSVDNVTHECFCDDVAQELAANMLTCDGKLINACAYPAYL